MSKGQSLFAQTKDIGISYEKPRYAWFRYNSNTAVFSLLESHYIPQDYNGDGKTDIIVHLAVTGKSGNKYGQQNISLYKNTLGKYDTSPKFELSKRSYEKNAKLRKGGFPAFFEVNQTNSYPEYAYVDGNTIFFRGLSKDNKEDMTLKSINNGGVVSTIYYDKVQEGNNNYTYLRGTGQKYPYININIAPNFKVVKMLSEKAAGITRKQDFRYQGAVMKKIFKGDGSAFSAQRNAEDWLKSNGYSYGSSSIDGPQGVVRGVDIYISK